MNRHGFLETTNQYYGILHALISVLKKKSNSIAYHFVREGCARNEWSTAYINTHKNVADLLTKPLPAGQKRMSFVRMILHHL